MKRSMPWTVIIFVSIVMCGALCRVALAAAAEGGSPVPVVELADVAANEPVAPLKACQDQICVADELQLVFKCGNLDGHTCSVDPDKNVCTSGFCKVDLTSPGVSGDVIGGGNLPIEFGQN